MPDFVKHKKTKIYHILHTSMEYKTCCGLRVNEKFEPTDKPEFFI